MWCQVGAANALHQHATRYCGQLQDYNGKLQAELQTLSEQLRLAQASSLFLFGNRAWIDP